MSASLVDQVSTPPDETDLTVPGAPDIGVNTEVVQNFNSESGRRAMNSVETFR